MTMSDMGDVLERFHRVLVEEIRARKPEYLQEPFTVAEIYQSLVPYSSHRDRIGVEMNGDYEDALLRLLAGQGGYLFMESEAALRQLREEMEESSPNTGLFREFAAVDVRLNPVHVPADLTGPGIAEAMESAPAPGAPTVAADAPTPDAPGASTFAADAPTPDAPAGDAESEEAAPSTGEGPTTCRWCRAELPTRQTLNYCPFCGTDIHVVPCPECGEELEPEWRFCISCGAEVHD